MWLDLPFAHVSRSVKQNVHTFFPFPNPLSESEEVQSWGCSEILLSFLMRFDGLFLTKSATATMCTSVRVDFGRPPLSSSSTSSFPSRNRECHLKNLIGSQSHSHKPLAPIQMFLSHIDRLWNRILWQLSVHCRHLWRIKNGLYETSYNSYTVEDKQTNLGVWTDVGW